MIYVGDSKNKVVRAGIAYTIGNVLLRGIAFLTLPIFTRILTTQEFGLFNVYVSYETILTIFSGVCLYGSLRTAWYDYRTSFDQYVSSILTLSLGLPPTYHIPLWHSSLDLAGAS